MDRELMWGLFLIYGQEELMKVDATKKCMEPQSTKH